MPQSPIPIIKTASCRLSRRSSQVFQEIRQLQRVGPSSCKGTIRRKGLYKCTVPELFGHYKGTRGWHCVMLLSIEPECYRVLQTWQSCTAHFDLVFGALRVTDIRRDSIAQGDVVHADAPWHLKPWTLEDLHLVGAFFQKALARRSQNFNRYRSKALNPESWILSHSELSTQGPYDVSPDRYG